MTGFDSVFPQSFLDYRFIFSIMTDLLRQEIAATGQHDRGQGGHARLTGDDGQLDEQRIGQLA